MNFLRTAVMPAVLLLGGLTSGCTSIQTTPAGGQEIAIEDVIEQVQQALADVQTALATRNFPPLKEVKLTLETVATRKSGGTLKLWVVGLGGAVENGKTQQITLTLVPPPASHPKLTEGVSLAADLEAAILSAADGVQKARDGKVPLVTSAVDVEINFTVKRSGSAGAGVTLSPVTVGISDDTGSTSTQTIKVSFAGH